MPLTSPSVRRMVVPRRGRGQGMAPGAGCRQTSGPPGHDRPRRPACRRLASARRARSGGRIACLRWIGPLGWAGPRLVLVQEVGTNVPAHGRQSIGGDREHYGVVAHGRDIAERYVQVAAVGTVEAEVTLALARHRLAPGKLRRVVGLDALDQPRASGAPRLADADVGPDRADLAQALTVLVFHPLADARSPRGFVRCHRVLPTGPGTLYKGYPRAIDVPGREERGRDGSLGAPVVSPEQVNPIYGRARQRRGRRGGPGRGGGRRRRRPGRGARPAGRPRPAGRGRGPAPGRPVGSSPGGGR